MNLQNRAFRFATFALLLLLASHSQASAASGSAAKNTPPSPTLEITLDAPPRAPIGSAFLARAFSNEQISDFTFTWMNKSVSVPAMQYGTIWFCEILLPVALGSTEQEQELRVSGGGGASAKGKVEVYEITRPVQKLNVDSKFVNPPKQMAARIERDRKLVAETLAKITPLRYWILPLVRPAEGSFSSPFGVRRMFNGETRGWHRGLDMRGRTGEPVRAAADGIVVLVENLYFSGNSIYIDHGLGFMTSYIHLSATDVVKGQTVTRGELIGKIGATGRVTGPHLHFSMYALGTSVDPAPFLEKGQEE